MARLTQLRAHRTPARLLVVLVASSLVAFIVGAAASSANASQLAERYTVRESRASDAITFVFSGHAPGVSHDEYVSQVVADASGRPIRLEGRAFFSISFSAARGHLESGSFHETAAERPSRPELAVVRQIRPAGDFEGVLSYGIGLRRRTGYRIRASGSQITLEFKRGSYRASGHGTVGRTVGGERSAVPPRHERRHPNMPVRRAAFGALMGATVSTVRASVSCRSVDFAPQSSDLAGSIRAGGVGCAVARRVAGASKSLRYGPYWPNGQFTPSPHRYRAGGFICAGHRHATPFMVVTYRCTRGRAWVTFDRA
jgi:hypothetical protein